MSVLEEDLGCLLSAVRFRGLHYKVKNFRIAVQGLRFEVKGLGILVTYGFRAQG